MPRTPLWAVFMFAGISGSMVIYCIKLFGIDALEYHGIAGAGAITGTAMAWYAIFNGLGRIAWGSVSDRIGRKTTITVMSFLQGITPRWRPTTCHHPASATCMDLSSQRR